MIEPKCVDPCSLRVRSRVGDRHGIARCKSRHRLLGRIDDAVGGAVSIFELEYWKALLGVRAFKADDCTLYVGGVRRRVLVVAVEDHSGRTKIAARAIGNIKRMNASSSLADDFADHAQKFAPLILRKSVSEHPRD
jgi:hypothetical protein